jgi:hypothetical protein
MRAWETATWAAGVREADVIARVGECVAGKIRELVKPGGPVAGGGDADGGRAEAGLDSRVRG